MSEALNILDKQELVTYVWNLSKLINVLSKVKIKIWGYQ